MIILKIISIKRKIINHYQKNYKVKSLKALKKIVLTLKITKKSTKKGLKISMNKFLSLYKYFHFI
jgi:hypothetical protein